MLARTDNRLRELGQSSSRRLLLTGALIVGFFVLAALTTPLWAPYPPNEQLDPVNGRERPPGTRLAAVHLTNGRWWLADQVERTPEGLSVVRGHRKVDLSADEVLNLTSEGVADYRFFALGSDRFSRDILSRMGYGARVSLTVAALAVLLAITVGVSVGTAAAVGGPWVDGILMRFVDGLRTFPRLFLLLALTTLFRPSNTLIVIILGLTAWFDISRMVRADVSATAQRDFVLAARASGASLWRIVWRHLLPNSTTSLLSMTSLLIGGVILAESSLSFLGLGLEPPQASWGNIINDGRESLTTAWWISTFPGIAIVVAVIGFNLVSDGLRDLLDPHTEP